jgi:hypothetical protein
MSPRGMLCMDVKQIEMINTEFSLNFCGYGKGPLDSLKAGHFLTS